MRSSTTSGRLQETNACISKFKRCHSRFLGNGSTDSESFRVSERLIEVLHFLFCKSLDNFAH